MVVFLMGVAGAGTTAIGRTLAAEIGSPFIAADSESAPRLATLQARAAAALDRRDHLVFACAPLTSRDRTAVRGDLQTVRFVYIVAGPAPPSQIADLEPMDAAIAVDAALPPGAAVAAIRRELGL